MNSQDLRIIDELKTIDEKIVKPNRLHMGTFQTDLFYSRACYALRSGQK